MSIEEREEQERQILEAAKQSGLQTNYFFYTTFDRYKRLLTHLAGLEKSIDEVGELTTKEYVKGRENIVINPAINAYNNTSSQANKTAETLLKILKGFKAEDKSKNVDPLLEIINGGGNSD